MERFLVTMLVCLLAGLSECQFEGELIPEDMSDSKAENDEDNTFNESQSAVLTTETTHQGCTPPIYTVLKELGAMEERLAATMKALEETNKKLEATEEKLSALNSTVIERSTVDKGQPQVAFSATLQIDGNIGPVNLRYPLVYRNVLSNIGGHYSPHTGYFTAPVRGVYYFTFTSFCWGYSGNSGGSLYQNGKHVVSWYGSTTNHHSSRSNSAVLMLQAGDMVNVRLWSDQRISDNENNYSTFSGFLLFSM